MHATNQFDHRAVGKNLADGRNRASNRTDVAAFSFGLMFHCHLLIPARLDPLLISCPSIHIAGKKKCREVGLRGNTF